MAYSILSVPRLGTPQHFLECSIEECDKFCQFYCNPCHQKLCEQCRDEHLKNAEYKNHEVVFFQQRKRQLPVEKCKIHPSKDIDMLCEECQIPLCSKCATKADHRGHVFIDLDTVYAKKMTICLEEISKLQDYFLPTSQDLQKEIKGDVTEIKMIMDSLRTAMKADGESLKNMVDTVVSDNMQQVDKIEQSLLVRLQNQDTTFDDYISYLHDLVKDFHDNMSSTALTVIIPKLSGKIQEIRPIPETAKPVTPVFTAGQYSKDDVAKLLGKIETENKKAKVRKINPMEIASPSKSMKPTSKQEKQDKDKKSDVKQTMSLSSSTTEVRVLHVQNYKRAYPALSAEGQSYARIMNMLAGGRGKYHITLDQTGRLWVSDSRGSLVKADLRGNHLQKIHTYGKYGYHTVTQDGDLIFTDSNHKLIDKIIIGDNITQFIKTGDWTLMCIHSSRINGDILVGMRNDEKAKVTRYNKTGEELQNMEKKTNGLKLYCDPQYITENINGNICVSDHDQEAVVVVNKSGKYIFSYTGQEQGLWFHPWGICTDVFGHIIVCSVHTVDLLDKDGQFLSLLLKKQHDICPRGVCVDDENNLYVGQANTDTVTVYKYLQ